MNNRSTKLSMAIIMGLCVLGAVPAAYAGSLEPDASPAPTMRPVDELYGAWSRRSTDAARFVLLDDFNNEAVLDRDTGLVWQRTPFYSSSLDFTSAENYCWNLVVFDRKGWRLPTVNELTSLIDPAQSFPALPTGHPFSVTPGAKYWAWDEIRPDLLIDTDPSMRFTKVVDLTDGSVSTEATNVISNHTAWCVRTLR